MRKETFIYLLFAAVLLPLVPVNCQDAQWRGPSRSGIFPDTMLMEEWPSGGPEILFVSEDIGRGYSSAVATAGRIYVTGLEDSTEYLTAMDLQGNILWRKSFGRAWNQSLPDSRCTPTVDGERVYVLTGLDNLACFHAGSGDVIWNVDVHEKYNSHWDMFGVSESILLVDDMVIVSPGGETTTVIALDKYTGDLVWKSASIGAQRSNLSPALIEHCGRKYIISADGMLYILEEKRDHMALVRADPDSFQVVSSFRVEEGKGPFWARPTIYHGMLLVRHGEKVIAYEIRRT